MERFHAIKGIKQHHSVNHNTWQQQRNIQVVEACQKFLVSSSANLTNLKR